MIKTFKLYKRNIKNKSKRRLRKRRIMKAGDNDKVICSICEKIVPIKETLIPQKCLTKYGRSAHRICENCWWDPVSGFAREYESHKCPGCIKKLPLTGYMNKKRIFVDLTEE